VYVIDDTALLIACAMEVGQRGLAFGELIAKVGIGLFEILPELGLPATGFANDEAEGGR